MPDELRKSSRFRKLLILLEITGIAGFVKVAPRNTPHHPLPAHPREMVYAAGRRAIIPRE